MGKVCSSSAQGQRGSQKTNVSCSLGNNTRGVTCRCCRDRELIAVSQARARCDAHLCGCLCALSLLGLRRDLRRGINHGVDTPCDVRCAETTRAAYSEPATKRKSGPKLVADAGPMTPNPGTDVSKLAFRLGARPRRWMAQRSGGSRKARRSTSRTVSRQSGCNGRV